MATSYCLPFAIFQFREFARQSYLAFELAAMVIVIGFLVCYWEDSQAKRAFSKERLTVAVMSLILFLILAPIFSSSAKFEAMVR